MKVRIAIALVLFIALAIAYQVGMSWAHRPEMYPPRGMYPLGTTEADMIRDWYPDRLIDPAQLAKGDNWEVAESLARTKIAREYVLYGAALLLAMSAVLFRVHSLRPDRLPFWKRRIIGWPLVVAGVIWIVLSPWLMFHGLGPWIADRFYGAWGLWRSAAGSSGCSWSASMSDGETIAWCSGFLAAGVAILFLGVHLIYCPIKKFRIP